MDDEALKALRALESIPWRPKTPRERKRDYRRQWGPGGKEGFERGDRRGGHESFIDLFNRLSAQHGTAVTDGLIEGEWPPFDYFRIVSHINDDLDLWFEATGERTFAYLRVAERLGLECWLWETHDRLRSDAPVVWARHVPVHRFKPNKSPKHDIPWAGAPVNWAPRRWFTGRLSHKNTAAVPAWLTDGATSPPWLMSISRALNKERKKARAALGAEVSTGEWSDPNEGGWFTDTKITTAGIYERKHPKPQGFWLVKKRGAGDSWYGCLIGNGPHWQPCEDEAPPASVLARTHNPPLPTKEPEPPRPSGYWRHVKGRPIMHGIEIVISPMQKVLVSLRRSLDFDHDDLDRLATSAAIEAGF